MVRILVCFGLCSTSLPKLFPSRMLPPQAPSLRLPCASAEAPRSLPLPRSLLASHALPPSLLPLACRGVYTLGRARRPASTRTPLRQETKARRRKAPTKAGRGGPWGPGSGSCGRKRCSWRETRPLPVPLSLALRLPFLHHPFATPGRPVLLLSTLRRLFRHRRGRRRRPLHRSFHLASTSSCRLHLACVPCASSSSSSHRLRFRLPRRLRASRFPLPQCPFPLGL